MNRRTAVHKLMTAGAGSFFSGWLAGAPPADETEIYALRSDVILVLLDVSVKNSQGRFVPGLTKDNFRVLEDGKPQKISVFDSEDRPVTLGILLDESLSMTPKRRDVLTAAETLVEESNRQDEVFVLHFNDRVTLGLPHDVPFSGDFQELRHALSRGIPDGKTALRDAVMAGLQHVRLGQRDKKTLVLVSDGGDTASVHSRGETLKMVQKSVATIYTIGLYDPDDPDHDPGFLRQLAKMSGGEAYSPASSKDLKQLCRQIAREIRTRYTIGYTPDPGSGTNSLRHVEVRAGAPGHGALLVRTRSTYLYENGQSAK